MKQRFSALDVCASVTDIRRKVVGHRLQNVYDVNSKTYLLKFAKPDTKAFLLVESGIRLHTTDFTRGKSNTPSNFCMKLRKHLRTRRLTNVTQLGLDRIVDFEFAGGDYVPTYHLITEFYAAGNVILTDGDYRILSLLRVVQPSEDIRIAVGQVYDLVAFGRPFVPVTADALLHVLQGVKPGDQLKKTLAARTVYGPQLAEHAILSAGLIPNAKVGAVPGLLDPDGATFQALLRQLEAADQWIRDCMTTPQPGYILTAPAPERPASTANHGDEPEASTPGEVFVEFHPFLFAQFQDKPIKRFDHFDQAVDQFFSLIETQKAEVGVRAQETNAVKKLAAIRREHEGRIAGLERAQQVNVTKASLLHEHRELVDLAITAIRNAVAGGLSWKDIDDLLATQRAQGNPVAALVHGLKLQSNQVTLALRPADVPDGEDEDGSSADDLFASDSDEEAQAPPRKTTRAISAPPSAVAPVLVDVDIYQSAFANAQTYFDVKKRSAVKHEKTVAVSTKAMRNAERTIQGNLKEHRTTVTINKMRKPYWFERFLWCITSDGHLVLAGRDMQQNELLVQKHLGKDDLYVHADLHGAASVVIKNPGPGEVPPSTLLQAGVMSVCQSKAWEAKIVTSAWWVRAHQVSKSAPTGEYLTTGSFMIRGRKNFLPPGQLVYGFGFLFRLEESCIGKHLAEHRRHRAEDEADGPVAEEPHPEADPADATEEFERARSKYNLDELTASETEVIDAPAPVAPKAAKGDAADGAGASGKRALTAKEKRDRRKKKDPVEPTPAADQVAEDLRQVTINEPPAAKSGPDNGSVPSLIKNPHLRGKKGKLKKIKKKYADQDEEDRARMMERIGAAVPPPPPTATFSETATPSIAASTEGDGPEPAGQSEFKPNLSGITSPDTPADVDNGESDSEDHQAGKLGVASNSLGATDAAEEEEIRQLLLEENIVPIDPEDNVSLLDTLTATPFPDDILLSAVPVCAPYSALQRYKYKVKLTPGALKKGKACKSALAVFLNQSGATPLEKTLIKNVPDADLIAQMLGKVKVSAPNFDAAKKAAKKGGGK
ncbi:hypothetical protein IWQ60_009196 [Tieghemiomyces parasiticus]|uniref:NFACT RNA-binding domain-containing protein n=1 Tax=Tieghemiomyces parasiticus TaxID=78921 RepID=A0A9W7ZTW7_9FUNG|nr:hypothetical protein IWQ60_009196 [Tieghemiomyces parasiticus]